MNLESRKPGPRSDEGLPEDPWVEYCRHPESLVPGNRVDLLVDGAEAYPAMLEAIAGAEKTVLMDSYIFNDDLAGRRFREALVERARAGVRVLLIVDGVGTWQVPVEFFDDMEREGVEVLVYRPLAPWRRGWGILRRNHRKLLVVDGAVGFAGGLNIGDEWLPEEQGGQGWHDIHVRVEGPAVRELAKLAVASWRVHARVELDQRLFLPRVEPVGEVRVNIIGSRERKKRRAIRQSYIKALRRARRYVYIANAYFLPDLGLRRALRNAVRRGVDVRVMVPRRGDILPVQLAGEALWGRLLKAGVRIFRWEEGVLHAKTAVIDGEWATVGSFNLDHRSWTMNLEVNVNVVGREPVAELERVFLGDQERAGELTRAEWRARSLLTRLAQRFCFLFRKWM